MDEKTAWKCLRLGRAAEPVAADAELSHESGQLCRSSAELEEIFEREPGLEALTLLAATDSNGPLSAALLSFASRSPPDQ